MKNKLILLLSLRNLLIITVFLGFCFFAPSSLYATNVQVNFFWGDGCPHCVKVKPIIENLKIKYPEVQFNSFEVYKNQNNALLLYKIYDLYKAPEEARGKIPVAFIGNTYFVGDKPITDNLENEIIKIISALPAKEEEKTETTASLLPIPEEVENTTIEPSLPTETDNIPSNNQTEKDEIRSYSLWAIAGAAIVDSINPCAIAVLLILLTALMISNKDKKRALVGGLFFTLSIYIAYFLFGLGLLQLIAVANLSHIIAKIVGVLALIIGLANIKDFFFYGGCGCVMEIPRGWRPTLKKILNGITSPFGAFLAGFVVTLFELPCTGGPYFFAIGLLSQAQSTIAILPVLLFYNLVFVLPLLLIVFIVYFGISSVERANEWKEKNIKLLHLVAGIIMLTLGVWVLFV